MSITSFFPNHHQTTNPLDTGITGFIPTTYHKKLQLAVITKSICQIFHWCNLKKLCTHHFQQYMGSCHLLVGSVERTLIGKIISRSPPTFRDFRSHSQTIWETGTNQLCSHASIPVCRMRRVHLHGFYSCLTLVALSTLTRFNMSIIHQRYRQSLRLGIDHGLKMVNTTPIRQHVCPY